MGYQTFSSYDGSVTGKFKPKAKRYDGVEYSPDVPDDVIVGSPGGVSSVHHHWTHGFYGAGASSSDVFGNQGRAYIRGEHGNIYRPGRGAGTPNAPDANFTTESNVEMLEQADTAVEHFTPPMEVETTVPTMGGDEGMKWLMIFVLALIAFVAFQFFARGGRMALQEKVFGGKISWQHSLIIAIVASVLFGLTFYASRGMTLE